MLMGSKFFNPQCLVGVLCSRAEVFTLLGRGQEASADLDRAWEMIGTLKNSAQKKQQQEASGE